MLIRTGLKNCGLIGHFFQGDILFCCLLWVQNDKILLPTRCSHQGAYVMNTCFKILIIFQMIKSNHHDRLQQFLKLMNEFRIRFRVTQINSFLLTTLCVLLHFELSKRSISLLFSWLKQNILKSYVLSNSTLNEHALMTYFLDSCASRFILSLKSMFVRESSFLLLLQD